ncbi:MAG: archaeosortase/exosortase family protein, partial [Verrucomicrobiota bacterium]|nr:archaeosortase/exosortase family protein [Verrucomicrobiota bacterium]
RPAKRLVLVLLAVLLAFATNLARTLALSLQGEWHGLEQIEKVHDLIGNIMITALIFGIWIAGKLLAPRVTPGPLPSLEELRKHALKVWWRVAEPSRAPVAAVLVCALAAFIAARAVYAGVEARAHTQTAAFFSARPFVSGDSAVPVPREIWNELHPTSGEYIRRESVDLPRGVADLYHFFWKPSPWNRFALVHRPDICMPGVGWKLVGPPEPVQVDFDGRPLRCYAFRFDRGPYHALQLWGVWRNGEPVPLELEVAQVLGDAVPPPALTLEGKRRSATEIIACTLISEDDPPPTEKAVAVLRSVFEYRTQ